MNVRKYRAIVFFAIRLSFESMFSDNKGGHRAGLGVWVGRGMFCSLTDADTVSVVMRKPLEHNILQTIHDGFY